MKKLNLVVLISMDQGEKLLMFCFFFNRVLVSIGAVGAIAPTVFESGGASTHGF